MVAWFRYRMNDYLPGMLGGALLLTVLLLTRPGMAGTLHDCARIVENAERLRCYDALARAESPLDEPVAADLSANPPEPALPVAREDRRSYLTRRWDLDESWSRGKFTILPHNDNYLMPVTYNGDHYRTEADENYTVKEVEPTEAQYQISFKTKAWQDILGSKTDLWLGYTQKSFWQLYNVEESAPFRETDYEPELLVNYRADVDLLGIRLRTLTAGLNHQSNGCSEPNSRSWNRVTGSLGLERGNFTLLLKSWYRIPEAREDDDNRDIDDYFGPGEIQTYYLKNNHRFGVLLRNNFQSDNRTTIQCDWSYPLMEKVGVYVQYFNGYGENLLDYDQHANRIGIGIILTDWN